MTRDELIAYFQGNFQRIYGTDINLDSDTPDGQWLNIIIQAVLDLQDLDTTIYNSFDPDNAIGNVLDQRVAINGIQRQAGTFTTTNITVVTNQTLNLFGLDQDIEPIYTVQDNAGNQWELITTQLGVTSGSHIFLFQSAVPGQVLTVPNTITIPVTIVLGVVSVNNPTTYSTLGINEESDAQLKIRRAKSVSLRAEGFYQALIAALENIPGVTTAIVIENDTSATDTDGIPGHSIWVIVGGTPTNPLALAWSSTTTYQYGDVASSGGINYISIQNNNLNHVTSNTSFWSVYNPIAQTIYNYRNAGCGMFNSMDSGAQSYVVIQVDGSSFTIYWDEVILQDLFIHFTANSLNGVNPPNITAIKQYIAENWKPGVYEEVNVNQLGTFVQLGDPNAIATTAGFGQISTGPYTAARLPSAKNNQWSITQLNTIIIPIIMACPNCSFTFTQVSGAYQVTNVTVSVASGGATINFLNGLLGGLPGYVFSMVSGAGSIGASTGIYTSATAGTDLVQVIDDIGNVGTATITVV